MAPDIVFEFVNRSAVLIFCSVSYDPLAPFALLSAWVSEHKQCVVCLELAASCDLARQAALAPGKKYRCSI